MIPVELWELVSRQLYDLVDDAARGLVPHLPPPAPEPSVAGTILDGRLLTPLDALPPGNSLVDLLREVVGDLRPGGPLRLHGWQRAPGAPRGVALVLSDPAGHAVVAVTPGGPVVDLVVTPTGGVSVEPAAGLWRLSAVVAAPEGWDVAFGPGSAPPPSPRGTAKLILERPGPLHGPPGVSVDGVRITVTAGPDTPVAAELELRGFTAAVLPDALAALVGTRPSVGPDTLTATVDRAHGLRFTRTGTLRADVAVRLDAPGVRVRGAAVELSAGPAGPHLAVSLSLTANLPGLPLRIAVDRAGIALPVRLSPAGRLGVDPRAVDSLFPEGIGVDLTLPSAGGGGVVRRTPDGGYAGMISIDLGFVRLQAVALLRPPADGAPTVFLVLLAAHFPPPGVQLGLGFALDAVGGVVGMNRRVDVTALQRLVCDGNADLVLFPDRAADRSEAIIRALSAAYPPAAGRLLVGPMVRISWLGRMVSLSGAVVLELPAPVRAVLVGRLLVTVPDPVAPLVRLQAGVVGRVDPGVPVVELLASLAGSWIAGLPVSGEVYLLVRGGARPVFVLSAGGFHPRYVRPAGVPALRRLQIDLAPGGGFGLRVEAYLAVTSNAVMFGGKVHLAAMIAGCGVEGWLGLDALFTFDPTFGFSVHVYAGVAVRAFGRRLASVGLDFTLEGPAPWHAFGTGSLSVLFWDVELDFDETWGAPPARPLEPGATDPVRALRDVIARVDAWTVQRPATERTSLAFTPQAGRRLSEGTLVHPDATFQVRQSVLPLGVPIARFGRRTVPRQTWRITDVGIGGPATVLGSVADQFVPGEFFDLSEDEKLSAPGFVRHAAGVSVGTGGVRVGPGHRVDDGYETGYEPRPDEVRAAPWPGMFAHDAVAAAVGAERVERWRRRPLVTLRAPTVAVATVSDLRPMIMDVPMVDATADVWQTIVDRVGPDVDIQLVEQWEVTP